MTGLTHLLRVKQYTKNVLVFAAPLYGGVLFNPQVFCDTLIAFVAFCCMASAVYIMNDILDKEKDGLHPIKCKRPVASGQISCSVARYIDIVLIVISMGLSLYVDVRLLSILSLYFIMNVAYSLKLKNVVIVDIFVIAFGFVMRAAAGVVAARLGVTNWFVLCVFSLCLFLALGKRRNEIILMQDNKDNFRIVLKDYSIQLIDSISNIVAAIMLTSYSLFAVQAQSRGDDFGFFPTMLLTVPVVMYGVFRYMYLVYIACQGERPEEVLLYDKHIRFVVFVYVLILIFIRNV